MKKYRVRMEFMVKSTDFADVEIEANSPEEAKELLLKKYEDGLDLDYYASDHLDSEVDTEYIKDWQVEEIPND